MHEEVGGERRLRWPDGRFKRQVVPPLADGGCDVGAAADVAFVVEKDPGWERFATASPTAGGSGGGIGGHREVV